jgi:hypothetical protein
MTRADWIIAGLCCAWLASLVWADLNASPAFVAALNGEHAADWMQVFVGFIGIIATAAAIYFSVRAGFLHQDRARVVAEAEAVTSAYLLARIAGAAVIHGDRWTRGAALDRDRKLEDQEEVRRYPAAWKAWTEDRHTGYIKNLEQIDVTTISDIRFIADLLTVRTRAEWYRRTVGPLIGNQALPVDLQDRLGWAARDVMKSLVLMRRRANELRRASRLSSIAVDRFPASEPPFSKSVAREKWLARTAEA